jgi:hypothetical protein
MAPVSVKLLEPVLRLFQAGPLLPEILAPQAAPRELLPVEMYLGMGSPGNAIMNAVMNRARQLREGILRTADAWGPPCSIARRARVVMRYRWRLSLHLR